MGKMSDITVLTEEATVELLLEGHSITRFGDGEFKVLRGGSIKSQEQDLSLTAVFQKIIKDAGHGGYLVGVPRLDKRGPKNDYWKGFMSVHAEFLKPGVEYGSALITRPDSAPWIDNDKYWDKIMQLWRNRSVALVWGGSRKSITPNMLFGVKRMDVIHTLPRNAWSDREVILANIDALPVKPEVCILVVGPTSTGLVPALVDRGIQALDMGHIGAWMRHLFRGGDKFKPAHGFFWPNGAEEYGKRYVRRAQHMDSAIRMCSKRRSVIQAGGHVGVWPKYLGAQFMQVYTFEPDHMNFLALCRNVTEKHIFRMQAALGDEHSRVNLVLHPANIGGHHIKGEGLIPQLKIDDLGITDCDLIVLDIEGSELAAIRGAEKTIEMTFPVIHMELKGHIEKYKRGTTEELLELLNGWGYRKAKEIGDDTVFVYGKKKRHEN